MKQHVIIGILAHVDSGKTTLAESLLYQCGSIPQAGRVDKGTAFLDSYAMERERGITIFSEQAELTMGDLEVTLLDTPGHTDFSAETERTLQVLDYALLVINGADGIQEHAKTLWNLLRRYQIPVFLFVNKMDHQEADPGRLMQAIRKELHERCIDCSQGITKTCKEEIALSSTEELVDDFIHNGDLTDTALIQSMQRREWFPCYFGSALKIEGIKELIDGISRLAQAPQYPDEFAARVYKIARDKDGNRLTHLKVTGGTLKVKMPVYHKETEEKIHQIRIYSGASYETAMEVPAGRICTVTGLEKSYCGEGLGTETDGPLPVLRPLLSVQMVLPEGCDIHTVQKQLRSLEDENPLLQAEWQEQNNEIRLQVMGKMELDVLKRLFQERFQLEVEFAKGSVPYRETILEPVVGAGHFEPLRHYAEVWLRLEPGPRNSGLQITSECREEDLEMNWQNQILKYLTQDRLIGVLTGSELTDMKIILIAGKAHPKHTEGGDFCEAAGRALRQALRKAKCRLLEPYGAFRLELPLRLEGKARTDIDNMHGRVQDSEIDGEISVLTGEVPISLASDYQEKVVGYTGGKGKWSLTFQGYSLCHNEEEVLACCRYDPDADREHPAGSVFCRHGSGTIVPWEEAEAYMHITPPSMESEGEKADVPPAEMRRVTRGQARSGSWMEASDKELEEIFKKTFGNGKQRSHGKQRYDDTERKSRQDPQEVRASGSKDAKEQMLLIDGYNVLHEHEALHALCMENQDAAIHTLIDILINYQAFQDKTMELVFDAYQVDNFSGSEDTYSNLRVIFTKEGESADEYIIRRVREQSSHYKLTVVTSDRALQMLTYNDGVQRISSRGFWIDLEQTKTDIQKEIKRNNDRNAPLSFREMLPEERKRTT